MRSLIVEYQFEVISALAVFIAGLYYKFAPTRESIWAHLELRCRSYRLAEAERKRVMSEGAPTIHGSGCLAHLAGRER